MHSTNPPKTLEALSNYIRSCMCCSSIESPGHAVPFEGDITSPILFLGRNPGREEFKQNRPFIGPGGKALDKFIEAAGLTRSSVMIANMVCCFTSEDRPPMDSEISVCMAHARALIGIQRPLLVVALGKQALHACVNTTDSPVHTHGQFYDALFKTPAGLVESKVMACWHPGSAVRSNTVMQEFMADAAKVKTFLHQFGSTTGKVSPT